MNRWKIAVEIDLMKLMIVVGMALSVCLSTICCDGTVLMLLIPAGMYGLISKEV